MITNLRAKQAVRYNSVCIEGMMQEGESYSPWYLGVRESLDTCNNENHKNIDQYQSFVGHRSALLRPELCP
jgi:hypothetical protein